MWLQFWCMRTYSQSDDEIQFSDVWLLFIVYVFYNVFCVLCIMWNFGTATLARTQWKKRFFSFFCLSQWDLPGKIINNKILIMILRSIYKNWYFIHLIDVLVMESHIMDSIYSDIFTHFVLPICLIAKC